MKGKAFVPIPEQAELNNSSQRTSLLAKGRQNDGYTKAPFTQYFTKALWNKGDHWEWHKNAIRVVPLLLTDEEKTAFGRFLEALW